MGGGGRRDQRRPAAMLAALTLLALLAGACADVCTPATAGLVTQFTQTLSDVVLPAGSKEIDVTLPPSVCVSDHARPRHVGTTLTACDQDAPPAVTLADAAHAHVSRATAAAAGVVHVTVYCSA